MKYGICDSCCNLHNCNIVVGNKKVCSLYDAVDKQIKEVIMKSCDTCYDWVTKKCNVSSNECIRYDYEDWREIPKGFKLPKESDPTGRNASDAGAKLDSGKIRYSLIPPEVLKLLAQLYTTGAEKYSDNGWKEVPNGEERYLDALMRHLEAYRAGELMDEDTNSMHIVNVAWNAFAIAFAELNK